MSLYDDYRPQNLEDFYGNTELKKDLAPYVTGKRQLPDATLLIGPSGCGKTTIGRMLAQAKGCTGQDYVELDSADFRGIDSIREIRRNMAYAPLTGNIRIWLLDECFHSSTPVLTAEGQKPIAEIKNNDSVYSAIGLDTVRKTYCNQVPLARMCLVTLQDGRTLLTTVEHKFFTARGWVEAKNLCDFDIVFQQEFSNECQQMPKDLQDMWPELFSQIEQCSSVQQEMPSQIKQSTQEPHAYLSILQERLQNKKYSSEELFAQLRKETRYAGTWRAASSITQCRGANQNHNGESGISADRSSQTSAQRIKPKNAEQQPCTSARNFGKNSTNKGITRNTTQSPNNSWGQWQSNLSTKPTIRTITRVQTRFGAPNPFRKATQARISNLLQSGHSYDNAQISHRSGWKTASSFQNAAERPQKRTGLACIRVASIKVFQSADIGKPEWNFVTHQDISRGYVEFFDLEMEKHHSYFANSVLVHNCHAMTKDAQNALLKALESPPKHVHFILCTTDPQALIKTILTRCVQFTVESLPDQELVRIMQDVCSAENKKVPVDVLKTLAKQAQGSARAALTGLEIILGRKPEDYSNAVTAHNELEVQTKALCQALLNRQKWAKIVPLLTGIKNPPEDIRRAVLGYMNAVMLSNASIQAANVIECFKEPTYNTGAAGLTLACFYATLVEDK